MNNRDPLSPDERELARLLQRSDVEDGPSAELDARIVAMSRQAAPTRSAGKPAAATRPGWGRRRLVSSLAAVASLVLVVGLAWQLRPPPPPPDMHDVSSETSPASAPAPSDPLPAVVEDVPMPPPAATTPQPRQQAPRPAAASSRSGPAKESANAKPGTTVTDSRAAPVMARRVAASAPPPASTNTQEPAPLQATDAGPPSETGAQLRAAVPERMPTILDAPQKAAGKAAAAASISAPVVTDIEADATLPPRQWLKRIRERRDSGDLAGARTSLRRFALDHPKASIPDDLRPLLEE